jgi:hypothetical protein
VLGVRGGRTFGGGANDRSVCVSRGTALASDSPLGRLKDDVHIEKICTQREETIGVAQFVDSFIYPTTPTCVRGANAPIALVTPLPDL